MGFWKKLFGGSNQPDSDKDETVGVDPTTDKKMKHQQSTDDSDLEGAKYTGRPEDTKAQRQADPETRKIVKDAENYPKEAETRKDSSTEAAVGKQNTPKSEEEKRQSQPKPGAKQKTTPQEAKPGSGATKAGQHHEKD